MENILFSLNLIAPIFILIFLGIMLKAKNLITESFTSCASSLIYKIALPAMVFLKIAEADLRSFFDIKMLLMLYGSTLVIFALLWLVTPRLIKNPESRGVFQQGSIRGNYAIIGFAIIQSLYGSAGLARAAILLAFIMPLNNILAIISLSIGKNSGTPLLKQFGRTLLHPLILAVPAALPFSLLGIDLPRIIAVSGGYLSSMVLPLALLAIGATLRFKTSKEDAVLTGTAAALKLIFLPALQIGAAFLLGFSSVDLGVLAVFYTVPTAVVSYIMAEGMDSNAELAAGIVAVTTIFSIFSLSAVITIGRITGAW